MNTEIAARALMALGHEKRLEVFKLLIQAGYDGLSVGDIQEHLDIPASTLAHHLSLLVDGGLVKQEKQGRKTYCFALFEDMRNVFDFVTQHCCEGIHLKEIKGP